MLTSKFKYSFVPAVFVRSFSGIHHFYQLDLLCLFIYYSFYHIALNIFNYFYFISGNNKYNSVQFNSVHEVALTSIARQLLHGSLDLVHGIGLFKCVIFFWIVLFFGRTSN